MTLTKDQIHYGCWRCSCCGEKKPDGWCADSAWRWNGEAWEHRCPGTHPQVGHNHCRLFE